MTIYGDGTQTRSFQYVSDLVAGAHLHPPPSLIHHAGHQHMHAHWWPPLERRRVASFAVCLRAGMVAVMDGPYTGPFNIGNPTEFTMLELAQVRIALTAMTEHSQRIQP